MDFIGDQLGTLRGRDGGRRPVVIAREQSTVSGDKRGEEVASSRRRLVKRVENSRVREGRAFSGADVSAGIAPLIGNLRGLIHVFEFSVQPSVFPAQKGPITDRIERTFRINLIGE